MLDVKTSISTKEVSRMLGDLAYKMPSAFARGLTETAKHTKQALRDRLPRYIDRPTKWTLNSMYVFPAEKTDLRSAVAFKTESGKYPRSAMRSIPAAESMRRQVYGGQRKLKAFENTLLNNGITKKQRPYVVPGPGAKLNKFGNVTTAFMNKVFYTGLSRGSNSQGYDRPLNGRRSASKNGQYFIKSKGGFGVPIGIFQRKTKRKAVPVFFFVDRARYDPRFPFERLGVYHSGTVIQNKMIESVDVIIKKYR